MLVHELTDTQFHLVVDTVREPLVVLDSALRVKMVNNSFCRTFRVTKSEVSDCFVYELGNGQWNIPALRNLLEKILPEHGNFENYQIEHTFTELGRRTMRLNARQMDDSKMILLAIEDVTERQNVQQLIKDSELRLRLANDAALLGTWDLDITTGKLIWSDHCKILFGVPLNETMTEAKFLELVHPDDIDLMSEAKKRLRSGETHGEYDIEFRCIRRDGNVRWIKSKGRMFFEKAGPARLIGTALDITELKMNELALRESEAWLRQLINAIPQLVWTAQPNGQPDYWNKQVFQFSGLTPENLEGDDWQRIVHPDDLSGLLEAWKGAVKSGVALEAECRLRRFDNEYLWHLIRAHPMRDGLGTIVRWFATNTEIDFKKRTEEDRAKNADEESRRRTHAEEAERRAAFLAEASEALTTSLNYVTTLTTVTRLAVPRFADICNVYILEREGAIRHVAMAHIDPAMLEMQKMLGDRYLPVLQAQIGAGAVMRTGLSEWHAQVSDSLLIATACDEEHLKLLRENGVKSCIVVPMRANGHTLGAITFGRRDHERRYDRSDVALAEDLGRRAGMAVENARLYSEAQQALFTAKKAVGARDELIAIVSHDLKNPVNAIKLCSEHLMQVLPQEHKARKPVETIKHAVDRMNRQIGDLLDIASIDASTLSIITQRVSATHLLEQAFEILQPPAEKKGLQLVSVLPEGIPDVEVDVTRIVQLLGNLINNAIKFTPSGGKITVAVERREREICFSVNDTGPGIPDDQFEHLFDRYWQARETASAGTGLGLAISKGIAERHGGQIWVESKLGKGSTFFFTLPTLP